MKSLGKNEPKSSLTMSMSNFDQPISVRRILSIVFCPPENCLRNDNNKSSGSRKLMQIENWASKHQTKSHRQTPRFESRSRYRFIIKGNKIQSKHDKIQFWFVCLISLFYIASNCIFFSFEYIVIVSSLSISGNQIKKHKQQSNDNISCSHFTSLYWHSMLSISIFLPPFVHDFNVSALSIPSDLILSSNSIFFCGRITVKYLYPYHPR